jgi:ParB/RepB/Spo0J family partition protein
MAVNLNVEGAKRGNFFRIPLSQVQVDVEANTRFAPPSREALDELKASIKAYGQITPAEVLVLPDRRVKLISGHQRYAMLAELNAEDGQDRPLNCIPYQGNEFDAILRGIEENLRRANPSPMDHAKNIRTLRDHYAKSIEDIAAVFSRSTVWVYQHIKLLSLDQDTQAKVHAGDIPAEAAFGLAKLDTETRLKVIEDATDDNGKASIPELRKATRKAKDEAAPPPEDDDDDDAPKAKKAKKAEVVKRTAVEVRKFFDEFSNDYSLVAPKAAILAGIICSFVKGEVNEKTMISALERCAK